MLPQHLLKAIAVADHAIAEDDGSFRFPKYRSQTHYLALTKSGYYKALITMRHYIKATSDYYFSVLHKAKNVDLFVLTTSVSSPSGPGSDSSPVPIKFGRNDAYLADSCQFGFEPLLLNGMDKVYAYVPSIRGDDPDSRHLNQFFMCEAEIVGNIDDLTPIIEGYTRILAETMLSMPAVLKRLSLNIDRTRASLESILESPTYRRISFDDAVQALFESGNRRFVRVTKHGRDISPEGEVKLAQAINCNDPFWVTNYDRDRVPFYQKPAANNLDKVINADLIFPPLMKGAFGGEVIGCGQRQDDPGEMIETLKRQGVDSSPYKWYIDLRKQRRYRTTSGFGLGIERFIAWSLGRSDIKEVILYPRIKNEIAHP